MNRVTSGNKKYKASLPASENKNAPYGALFGVAEEEGFEPPDLLQSTVFKTAAIDRSAIPPAQK